MIRDVRRYHDLGWSIIPIIRGTKIPHITWTEFQAAPPSLEQLEAWWKKWPNANIGLITGKVSGLVVVDIDKPETLKDHDITALMAKTSRGFHLFYEHPGDRRIKLQAKKGTDVRGDGGLIILPPSVHESGKKYEWILQGSPSPCPAWILDAKPEIVETSPQEKSLPKPAVDNWLSRAWSGDVPVGERNSTCAKMAGQLAGLGQPIDVSMAMLTNWCGTLKAPIGIKEVETTVRSVYATEQRKNPGQKSKSVPADVPVDHQSGVLDLMTYGEFMLEYLDSSDSWDIEGWLPESTIAMIIAPPGSYKTWIEFDIAITLASGNPFMDGTKPGRVGPVLMFQQEDKPSDIAKRIFGMQCARVPTPKSYKDPDGTWIVEFPKEPPVYFHRDSNLRLDNPEVMDLLEQRIVHTGAIALIADPLYTVVPTEDHMAQAAKLMMRPKKIRNRTGCSFVFTHHTTKSSKGHRGRQRMHGSNLLLGSMESFLEVHKLGPEDLPVVCIEPHSKSEKGMGSKLVNFDIDLTKSVYSTNVRNITGKIFNEILLADDEDKITLEEIEEIITKPEVSEPIRRTPENQGLGTITKRVLGVLTMGEASRSQLQLRLGISAAVLAQSIIQLEKRGLITEAGGKYAVITASVNKKG